MSAKALGVPRSSRYMHPYRLRGAPGRRCRRPRHVSQPHTLQINIHYRAGGTSMTIAPNGFDDDSHDRIALSWTTPSERSSRPALLPGCCKRSTRYTAARPPPRASIVLTMLNSPCLRGCLNIGSAPRNGLRSGGRRLRWAGLFGSGSPRTKRSRLGLSPGMNSCVRPRWRLLLKRPHRFAVPLSVVSSMRTVGSFPGSRISETKT